MEQTMAPPPRARGLPPAVAESMNRIREVIDRRPEAKARPTAPTPRGVPPPQASNREVYEQAYRSEDQNDWIRRSVFEHTPGQRLPDYLSAWVSGRIGADGEIARKK